MAISSKTTATKKSAGAAKASEKKAPKPAAAKPAAKPAAASKAPAPKKPAARAKTARPEVSDEQRRHYVEVAAYFVAERHGFVPGRELSDWAEAEAEIDRLLAAGLLNP